MFSHWLVYWPSVGYGPNLVEIFISTTAGAWTSLVVFYFSSDYLMQNAARKRARKRQLAAEGKIKYKPKKTITRKNRMIVKVKQTVGIYGLTFLAPMFLSVPVGSIICAKFYGKNRYTFWLILMFTGCYSVLMCASLFLFANVPLWN